MYVYIYIYIYIPDTPSTGPRFARRALPARTPREEGNGRAGKRAGRCSVRGAPIPHGPGRDYHNNNDNDGNNHHHHHHDNANDNNDNINHDTNNNYYHQ